VFAPVSGTVVHAWSREEPYLLLEGDTRDVRAFENGEVMSIAHGMEEERIVRLRHTDGTESVYGNLESCSVAVGAQVAAGDIIGKLIAEKPLAFEVRVNGRSVDITHSLKPFDE
jgi:murein DD-endopeptidase MepM/ murein hydrolase activator NlpD